VVVHNWQRCLGALAVVLLLLGTVSLPTYAEDWSTKGGSALRQSVTGEPVGKYGLEGEWWRLEDIRRPDTGDIIGPGQSATQPIGVGNYIYHLAGKYLWRIDRSSPQGKPIAVAVGREAVNVDHRLGHNPDVLISSSTPTYSPESGMIYFGTAYGWLWGYDMEHDVLRGTELDGCPIVTSPLVMRDGNRDLVVVGDKDASSGLCNPGHGGKAWVVWGLDDPNGEADKAFFPLGGWVTASAVPAAGPRQFIIGSDGVYCKDTGGEGYGKVLMLEAAPSGSGYSLVKGDWRSTGCTDVGQAGGLAATDETVYWVDKDGFLWARNRATGKPPDGWPAKVNLPGLIAPDGIAFTNTEPAIDPEGQAIYVTLRNFTVPGEPGAPALRGCGSNSPIKGCEETGAPGAIVAVNLADASLKWQVRLPAVSGVMQPSINTSPLLLQSQGVALAGDVNGNLRSYALRSYCEDDEYKGLASCQGKQGKPGGFGVDGTCSSVDGYNLLSPGEVPARGKETWSQVSGVGTDPMAVPGLNGENRLLAVGVNYAPPGGTPPGEEWRYGRLVAFKARIPYNLRWVDAFISQAPPWSPGQELTLTGHVQLDTTPHTLGELVDRPVSIRLFALDRASWRTWDGAGLPKGVALPAAVPLPATLTPGEPMPVAATFTVTEAFPDDGYLVAAIDLETLGQFQNTADLNAKRVLEVDSLKPLCPGSKATEVAFTSYGPSVTVASIDNWAEMPYTKQDLANVSIEVRAPASAAWSVGGSYQAEFRITNHSGRSLDVPVATAVRSGHGTSWNVGSWTQTVGPGETVVKTRKISLVACSDVVTVTGQVNAEPRSFAETAYDDNEAAAATLVGPCDASPELGASSAGQGYTIIVPANCIPNDNITSNRPCKNYPLTITR
jgi:hypothetical protein